MLPGTRPSVVPYGRLTKRLVPSWLASALVTAPRLPSP